MKEDKFQLDPSDEDRISLEASAWIAKSDEGFSGEDQDGFLEWLAKDPAHREIYNERLAFWNDMNHLEDWRPEHSQEPNPDLLAYHPRRKPTFWYSILGGIAALLVVGIFLAINGPKQDGSEMRVLAFGGADGYENHVLDDGSVVELNRGAEVSVQYSKDTRLIFLHKGEAHFMVSKDLERPFLVRAGAAVVRATGTAFNVALENKGVAVLVTEGRVVVNTAFATDGRSDTLDRIDIPAQELVAGQLSILSDEIEETLLPIDSISSEQIEKRLIWKSEILDFTKAPLHEVAQEFNRRNITKIVLGEPGLGDLEITAKLRSDNLEGFVALLAVAMNIESDRERDFEIVLRTGDALSSQ